MTLRKIKFTTTIRTSTVVHCLIFIVPCCNYFLHFKFWSLNQKAFRLLLTGRLEIFFYPSIFYVSMRCLQQQQHAQQLIKIDFIEINLPQIYKSHASFANSTKNFAVN